VIDLGHWTTCLLLEDVTVPYGFIYIITNKCNNKKYIGKKAIVKFMEINSNGCVIRNPIIEEIV